MVIVMASAFIIVPASTMLMNPNVLGLNFITLHFYQANTGHDHPNLVRHSAGIVTAWFAEVSGKQVEIKLG